MFSGITTLINHFEEIEIGKMWFNNEQKIILGFKDQGSVKG